jgi:UDP-GlcNAc:undecaprenyl-phosphate/decaprenyl-phosphate GlcNAc-1-phosphate transferase
MSDVAVPAMAGFAVGLAVAVVIMRMRLASPPPALMRININGKEVPAVLGDPVVVGSLVALGALTSIAALGWEDADTGRVGVAATLIVAVMWIAGRIDDRRGDEVARGFRGHIKAALGGRITGGFIKIVAGGISGVVAGAVVAEGLDVLLVGSVIALAANLFNLLDRAPGRAAKLWLVAMVPLFVLAPAEWAVAVAGTVGAALAVLPADLAARGMLGDAGANPLGAVWGLGLALSVGTAGRAAAAAALLLLNLISERYSFSDVIDRTPPLRVFDRLGRK